LSSKTAKQNNGTFSSAPVQGIRLSTLVKNAMIPFQNDASPSQKTGGLLIIKMDVEGAEYQVIKEVASSGVLCDYIRMGNKVVMIVETHRRSITDAAERNREESGFAVAKKVLADCGVEFGNLAAGWA
jgi:hypothetical protein